MRLLFITIFCLCTFVSSGFSKIKLSFTINDGRAWFDANSNACDPIVDNIPDPCDPYVIIKIDGKEVYRTKQQDDTDHPIFNESFKTALISRDSLVVFEMKDRDVGNSTDVSMSTWSGNADYYLKRDLLVGKVASPTFCTHRNLLSVSTELIEDMQLSITLREGGAYIDADGNACDSPVDGQPNPCDAYVVVKIDGQQVYQTKVQNNKNNPGFWESFETGIITADSIITLEMWDDDVGHSLDDPMSIWSGNYSRFSGRVYFEGNVANGGNPNFLRANVKSLYPKKAEALLLSFNIKDGRAFFDANANACDFRADGSPDLCDAYVIIKIDGEEVYRTKQQHDTDQPTFNETFETGPITKYSIITFEMWDGDNGDSSDGPLSTWSGYPEYYLSRDLFVGNVTDAKGSHRNSLSISTKVVVKKSDVLLRVFFNIADGQAKYKKDIFSLCYDIRLGDTCNPYVRVKIDGNLVYQTKIQNATSHPVFNEIYETEWISEDSSIQFEMLHRDEGNEYPIKGMNEWSGNVEYFLTNQLLTEPRKGNSLLVSTSVLDRKRTQDIQLSFNLKDGQAWLREDSTPCDNREGNPCDAFVELRINHVKVFLSKLQKDTNYPVYNESFRTGWISRDTIIQIQMIDNDNSADYTYSAQREILATWSGTAEYFVNRDVLEGSATDGTHRNSLNVAFKLIS